jgi:small-conductance mechanosensitive channel
MRLEQLEAERDEATNNLKRMHTRVQLFENMLSGRRVAEAEQARMQAEEAQRESRGKHPLVQEMAQKNAALSEELGSLATGLERVSAEDDTVNKQAEELGNEFRSTRQKVELAGLGQALGPVLFEQQRELPNPRLFHKQTREHEQKITAAGLRLIQYEEERQKLSSIADYVDGLRSVSRRRMPGVFAANSSNSRQTGKRSSTRPSLSTRRTCAPWANSSSPSASFSIRSVTTIRLSASICSGSAAPRRPT